jgi:hypothetical protein
MHKIAIASPVACVLFILTTCGFPEISHWREVQNDGSACVESATQCIQGRSSVLFLSKFYVDVADHVVCKVVANVEIFDFSIFAELLKNVFVEILKVLLKFARIRLLNVPVLIHAAVKPRVGRLIHVRQQQSLTRRRPVVKARAAVAMTADANLEVERTVDTVLLRAEDGGKMLRHGGGNSQTLNTTQRSQKHQNYPTNTHKEDRGSGPRT